MPVTRLRQLAPLIQAAGLKISRELGYQPSKVSQRTFPIAKSDAAGESPLQAACAGRLAELWCELARFCNMRSRIRRCWWRDMSALLIVRPPAIRPAACLHRDRCAAADLLVSLPRRTGFPTTATTPAGDIAPRRNQRPATSHIARRSGCFTPRNTNRLEVTPVVVNGMMFVTAANDAFALDARTGREIWHHSRPITEGLIDDASRHLNRGVAVWATPSLHGDRQRAPAVSRCALRKSALGCCLAPMEQELWRDQRAAGREGQSSRRDFGRR